MRCLITAGPTREPIDAVRYISNRSSGKMGYALAEAALALGWDVVLVSGPVALKAPEGVVLIPVTTAKEMAAAVEAEIGAVDVAILAAAVADFTPKQVHATKLKKRDGIPLIELVPTRDILGTLGAIDGRSFYLAGFAAETVDLAANAREKLEQKGCDLMIANDVSQPGIGFDGNENAVTCFFADGRMRSFAQAAKTALAERLIALIAEAVAARR